MIVLLLQKKSILITKLKYVLNKIKKSMLITIKMKIYLISYIIKYLLIDMKIEKNTIYLITILEIKQQIFYKIIIN